MAATAVDEHGMMVLLAIVAFAIGWFAKTVRVQLEMYDAGIWEEFLKYRQAKRAKKKAT